MNKVFSCSLILWIGVRVYYENFACTNLILWLLREVLILIYIQTICKIFWASTIEINLMTSIFSMIQTILLVSNYNNETNEMWRSFIDGFQYFKFNFRFLNIVFYLQSSVEQHHKNIPSRMYYLFFENKAAIIWFWNFLLVFLIILWLKAIKYFIIKIIKRKLRRSDNTEEVFQISTINQI